MIPPTFIMLIGLPGSGKTSFRKRLSLPAENADTSVPTAIISADDEIEARAAETGRTYSDVYVDVFPVAAAQLAGRFEAAMRTRTHIIWDQINIWPAARQAKLRRLPGGYSRLAVYFELPEPERQTRLKSRPGKVIPVKIDSGFRRDYERPALAEGFDLVLTPEDFATRFPDWLGPAKMVP